MRKVSVCFLILILCGVWINLENLKNVKGNSTDQITFPSGTTVFSPLNITYNTRSPYINLTFNQGAGISASLNYTMDGIGKGSIPLVNEDTRFHTLFKKSGSVKLPELTEGPHCLTIDVLCGLYDYHGAEPPSAPFTPTYPGSSDYTATWTHTINFTIDTSIPEFPSWIILPLFLMGTFSLILLKRKNVH